MQTIAKKLPFHLQARRLDRAVKLKEKGRIANFKDLVEFLVSATESANDPIFGVQALNGSQEECRDNGKRDNEKKPPAPNQISSSFATNITSPASSDAVKNGSRDNTGAKAKTCLFCNKARDLDDCVELFKKTMDERKSFLKEKRLCFACNETDHVPKGCAKRRTCQKCKKRHPTALHIDGFMMNRGNTDNQAQTTDAQARTTDIQTIAVNNGRIDLVKTVCGTKNSKASVVLHAILPVKVKRKGSGESVTAYAFYDNGSGGCFATESTRRQLGVEGVRTVQRLPTMHGESQVESIVMDNLIVTSLNDDNPIELPHTYTRDEIPADHRQTPMPNLISHWAHLSEIARKIPEFEPHLEIGLLVGSNCPAALEPLEVVPCQGDGPFALRLRHGWTVSGPLRIETNQDSEKIIANRITVREVEIQREIMAPKTLLQMFEMDFNDHTVSKVQDERGLSQEDRKFLNMAAKETKVVDGHY